MPPKPPKPGSRATPSDPLERLSTEFLALLSEADRRRLAVRFGVPSDGDPTGRILAAAATSGGARHVIASLERDAREALLAMCVVTDPRDVRETETMLRDVHGWSLPRTRAALDRLREHALVVEEKSGLARVLPFPMLARGLGHDRYVWLAGATADAPPPPPFVRRLALLLAHVHADPIQRTQQRLPAVRWLERAAAIFDAIGFPRRSLVNLISWLSGVDALDLDESGESMCVAPGAADLLRGAPEDLALAYAKLEDLNPAGSLIATLVALDRARQEGDASPTIEALTKVAKAWGERSYVLGAPYDPDRVEIYGIAWAIRRLRLLGLVEATHENDTVVIRRTQAARVASPFRCTVLPTFEILVGADADPAGTADLGRIADLVSADRVARFVLTAESVARAALGPGGAEAAIERLAAAAEHGLPDGVRATITGWARRARAMRMYEGTVVVAETPEHAAWLRANARAGAEIAPNVFRVEADEVEALRAAAEASKLPIARIGGGTKRSGADSGGLREVERSAKEVRERIDRWAKPVPAKPKGKRKSDETPYEATEPYPVLDALFEDLAEPTTYDELHEDWPRIARAVRKLPDLLDVALRLTSGDLDEMEFETTTAGELLKALLAWKHDLEDDSPPTTRDRVPQPIFVESSPASDVSTDAQTWRTMPIGALSAWLENAAAGGDTVEIVYVNAAGVRSERKVVAQHVVRAGGREWLEARDVAAGATTRFDLDRIAAVRGA